tara:strand:- start:12820 stop:13704 length:885 start_codon:yes stop_codon:yes gene_type:complete
MSGVGGMLGEAFYYEFNNLNHLKCTDIDTSEEWIDYLDFRDRSSYIDQVTSFRPDWLFHIGAHTDLEYCEKNPLEAYNTNTESVKIAVEIANSLSIPLLYISTAGIFSGSLEFFDENDIPEPIGHYGRSKFLGEKYIISNSKDYLICRAGWMMGGGLKKDKKFVAKIIKQILDGKKELNIVNDKQGTPTYTIDFSKNVNHLIKNNKRGLYNMVCNGLTSRIDVAKKILEILDLSNKIKINSVDSSFFSKSYFAQRPDNERLINKKLEEEGLNIMQDWEKSLTHYLKEHYLPISR